MNLETKSVISFLKENPMVVNEYSKRLDKSKNISYSDFLFVTGLNGTTKEKVSLDSCMVSREKVTSYLRAVLA